MEIIQNLMTILKPSDGYWLTDGVSYTDLVFLGEGQSPSKWHEIPIEEVPQDG